MVKREVLDNLTDQQYTHILIYNTRLLRNPNSSSAMSSFSCQRSHQVEKGKKTVIHGMSELVGPWKVMRWRNSFYIPHQLVLNAARNKSLYTQDGLSNFLMALIWHLSHYNFYPLVLALSWAPSENLQFPAHVTAVSVYQVFSFFGPMFPVTSTNLSWHVFESLC